MLFDILGVCNFTPNILANMQASKGFSVCTGKKKKLPSCSCAHVHGKVGGVFQSVRKRRKADTETPSGNYFFSNSYLIVDQCSYSPRECHGKATKFVDFILWWKKMQVAAVKTTRSSVSSVAN